MSRTASLVTVFGSLHYDITVDAPDRPRKGETVTGRSWLPKCGGKGGNQAVAAARVGAAVAMIGAVGDDDFGRVLVDNLDRKMVDRRFVRTEPTAGTGMSVAIFDNEGDYGAIIVSGANLTLAGNDVAAANELIARTSVLLLQNEVPDAANVAAARAVKRAGGRVVLNAAPARELSQELISLVDILVVNAIEAEMLGGTPVIETLHGAASAASSLLALCPAVIVTAGGDGVAFADRKGQIIEIEAMKVRVESTHGAGDEFVGAIAAALACGQPIKSALHAANRAAALLVGTPLAEAPAIG
jgi:ribokinase